MARVPIPTWCFALVVVRWEDRFLLVHERQHGQVWYLPAGRVELGESFVQAAERETLEESGVAVQIEGIVRVEHSPQADSARLRIVFTARPSGDPTPKSIADEESLGAAWVRLEELDEYPLRGPDVRAIFEYVAQGGPIYPPSLLQPERAPLRR